MTAPAREEEGRALDKVLWCCHVLGPDDLHAAPSYEAALAHATALNAAIDGRVAEHPELADVLCKAVPALWPWSPEGHASALAKAAKGA